MKKFNNLKSIQKKIKIGVEEELKISATEMALNARQEAKEKAFDSGAYTASIEPDFTNNEITVNAGNEEVQYAGVIEFGGINREPKFIMTNASTKGLQDLINRFRNFEQHLK